MVQTDKKDQRQAILNTIKEPMTTKRRHCAFQSCCCHLRKHRVYVSRITVDSCPIDTTGSPWLLLSIYTSFEKYYVWKWSRSVDLLSLLFHLFCLMPTNFCPYMYISTCIVGTSYQSSTQTCPLSSVPVITHACVHTSLWCKKIT